jgi:hypothetical protein
MRTYQPLQQRSGTVICPSESLVSRFFRGFRIDKNGKPVAGARRIRLESPHIRRLSFAPETTFAVLLRFGGRSAGWLAIRPAQEPQLGVAT